MTITITYCVQCDYRPRAAGLADAVERAIGVRPQLIEGAGGIFNVKADGRMVFSRKEVGRFPEDDEVIKALRKLKAK